jgi:hypothetical protein
VSARRRHTHKHHCAQCTWRYRMATLRARCSTSPSVCFVSCVFPCPTRRRRAVLCAPSGTGAASRGGGQWCLRTPCPRALTPRMCTRCSFASILPRVSRAPALRGRQAQGRQREQPYFGGKKADQADTGRQGSEAPPFRHSRSDPVARTAAEEAHSTARRRSVAVRISLTVAPHCDLEMNQKVNNSSCSFLFFVQQAHWIDAKHFKMMVE